MKYHSIVLSSINSVFALLLVAGVISGNAWGDNLPVRERTLFNDGWRFHRGDAPDLKPGDLDAKKLRDYLLHYP